MHLTISRARLAPAVADTAALTPKRTTIPILADLRLEADENTLTISATNQDAFLQITLEANVIMPGCGCIPADTLHRLISASKKAGDIEISLEGDVFTLSTGTAVVKAPALPADDYPDIGALAVADATDMALVPAAELAALFSSTLPAASSEETRHYLMGVFLTAEAHGGEVLRAVATDGHMLIAADMPLPDGIADMLPPHRSTIVPREAVPHILRVLERAGAGEAQIDIDERRMAVRAGDVSFATLLIDGTYPEYQRVIPEATEFIRASAASLADALKLTQVVTAHAEKGSAILLDAAPQSVTLRAAFPAEGLSASERVEATCQIDRAIGLNPKYLAATATAMGAETLSIGFGESSGVALLLRAVPDNGRQAVVMPMRCDGAR